MKKILLVVFLWCSLPSWIYAQCTTNNATTCRCKDSTSTDCDLLPDIQLGHPPFYQYNNNFGIIEFSQTGNGVDDGRLKVTVSTPNAGLGPLEIRTTNVFVCGTDTFIGTAPAICPDGITYPRISVNQRVYHKNGSTMTYYDRPAGTMTYHPTHNHMHVDNWGNYTLRTRDTAEVNPLNWPIVGSGTKLAFCVEDYGTCPGYPGHCMDSVGNPLNVSTDFPNYGLGGGGYACSPTVQGISSGYVDIYWTDLDGMWITLPSGVCNGEYYIVCEVDPNHNFLESDETNNVFAVPYTLTKQDPNPAATAININASGSSTVCQGDAITLSVNAGTLAGATYHWSNGDTTSAITTSVAGMYTCDITNHCGTGTSSQFVLTTYAPAAAPTGVNDTIPVPGTANLTATAAGTINWYDQPSGGSLIGTGTAITTPFISTSTTYYAESSELHAGAVFNGAAANNVVLGVGGYYTGDQSEIFDVTNPFVLHTVTVYAQTAGTRVIELHDASAAILQQTTVNVVVGMNVLTLDFLILPGTGYRLTRTGGDLYRNNPGSGISYPFTIGNMVSITGSTAGAGYYYFFYDWNIHAPDVSCVSPRVPVEAIVSNPNAIADVNSLSSFQAFPNPASSQLTVSFTTKPNEEAIIEIVDAIGKIVNTRTLSSTTGSVNENFNVSGITTGVYSIHVLSTGKNYYKQIVISK